jgi:GDP-L-fucose synthase
LRVAVIGGTGLIGRHVVELLSRSGNDEIVASYHTRPPFAIAGVDWVRADLAEARAAEAVVGDSEAVVICAGKVSTSTVLRAHPYESILATMRIVTNVLEACAARRAGKVVMISSLTVYPATSTSRNEDEAALGDPPDSWFGVGWLHRFLEKQLEWYVSRLGLVGQGMVFRPSLVYGPHDDFDLDSGHFVPAMVRQVVERQTPIRVIGDGRQRRNLLHAHDLARAVELGLRLPGDRFQVFNVASEQDVSVRELIELLLEIDDFADVALEFGQAGPSTAGFDISTARFRRAAGWTPSLDLRSGLTRLLAWYRANRPH